MIRWIIGSMLLMSAVSLFSAEADSASQWEQAVKDAVAAYQNNDLTVAIEHTQAALSIAQQWGNGDERYLVTLENLALFHQLAGRLDVAEDLLRRSLAARKLAFGPTDVAVLVAVDKLIELNHARQNPTGLIELYNEALTIRREAYGDESPEVATTLNDLGGLYFNDGQAAKASDYFERALAIRRSNADLVGRAVVAASHSNLAIAQEALGGRDDAITNLEFALALLTGGKQPDTPFSNAVATNLIRLYREQGRDNDAARLENQITSE